VRQAARDQLARGQREQSLQTIASALQSWPNDTQLKAMMSSALSDARTRLRAARDAATRERGAANRSDYREAVRREQQATTFARAGRTEEAVRSSWLAADLFTKAASESKAAAADAASRTPAESSQPATAPAQPPRVVEARPEPTPPTPPAAPAPAQPAPSQQAAPAPVTPEPPPPERPAPPPPQPAPTPPPAAAAAPPAAAAAPARPAPRTPADEQPLVQRVVREYADAYSRLDAGAVKRVFPSVNEQALRQNFSATKSQQVQIQNETITVNGTTATVTCTWSTVFTGQVGGVQRAAPRIVLRLQKVGENWVIVERR
jgi:hypothetical protein